MSSGDVGIAPFPPPPAEESPRPGVAGEDAPVLAAAVDAPLSLPVGVAPPGMAPMAPMAPDPPPTPKLALVA